MQYKFICPNCGAEQMIQMRISEYRSEGHLGSCGTEMIRDPKDFCKNYDVKCDGFYAEHQSN